MIRNYSRYKLFVIAQLIILFVLSCEDKKKDTTPPTITITFPQNNETVSGQFTITCMATDNEGVAKVELWVDGDTTGVEDHSEPYSLLWNTETYEGGPHNIIVRAYDTNDNKADSEPVVLIVSSPDTIPPSVMITSPTTGDSVSVMVMVSITCNATDNQGVAKVELWVDGVATSIEDQTEPFQLNWVTTHYPELSTHSVQVRAYDTSGNISDSDPILLTFISISSSCSDGIDNDGDGLTDNNDIESCGPNGIGEIPSPLPPNCADEVDNDEDTFVDALDPDCARFNAAGIAWVFLTDSIPGYYHLYDPAAVAPTGEQIPPPKQFLANCADGEDNDGNGKCDLDGCTVNNIALPPDTANCGYYDLTVGMVLGDASGEFAPAEVQVLANCDDGVDNDEDGDTDLEDDDCNPAIPGSIGEIAPQIPPPPFSCYDGVDNDEDGFTDGDDSDCVYNTVTGLYGEGGGEINIPPSFFLPYCNDGLDNDEDGLIDLEDVYDCIADSGGMGEFPPPVPE